MHVWQMKNFADEQLSGNALLEDEVFREMGGGWVVFGDKPMVVTKSNLSHATW